MKVIMGGFVTPSSGQRRQFSEIENPTPDQIDDYLRNVSGNIGCLRLELGEVEEDRDIEIVLYSQRNEFLLTLHEKWDSGRLRTFHDPDAPNSLVDMHGEPVNARWLFRDLDIARRALTEFCEKGDVGLDLLS